MPSALSREYAPRPISNRAMVTPMFVSGQRRHGLAGLESGVELDKGVGPEAPTSQFRVDEVIDLHVVDAQEALDVGTVFGNDRLAQLKDIHILPVFWWHRPPALLRSSRPGVSPACGPEGTACLSSSYVLCRRGA